VATKGQTLPTDSSSGLGDGGFKRKKPFVKQAVSEAGHEGKSQEEKESTVEDKEFLEISGSRGTSASSSSDSKMDTSGLDETSPPGRQPEIGFSSLITDFGTDFKNSRSRKSPIFVADDNSVPLIGWRSLRKAGISTKKIGKIRSNGYSIPFQQDGHKGKMYFVSDKAFKALKRKKHIDMRYTRSVRFVLHGEKKL
jgi:hypothetical protein